MPIAPSDFLVVAQTLKSGSALEPKEPRDRTIVGRAYYAAYLAAREAVRKAYGKPGLWVAHEALATNLAGVSDAAVADVGIRLQTLKQTRKRADYELKSTVTANDVALMCASADRVIASAPKIVSLIPQGLDFSPRPRR